MSAVISTFWKVKYICDADPTWHILRAETRPALSIRPSTERFLWNSSSLTWNHPLSHSVPLQPPCCCWLYIHSSDSLSPSGLCHLTRVWLVFAARVCLSEPPPDRQQRPDRMRHSWCVCVDDKTLKRLQIFTITRDALCAELVPPNFFGFLIKSERGWVNCYVVFYTLISTYGIRYNTNISADCQHRLIKLANHRSVSHVCILDCI